MAWWLGRGRGYERFPPIEDAEEFGMQTRRWWVTLQPAWRKSKGEDEWPLARHAPLDEDWGTLAKGGANGLMVFLVALGWWFNEIDGQQAARELASVVEDVRWVLDEIKGGISDGKVIEMLTRRGTLKRDHDGEGEKGAKAKKRLVFCDSLTVILILT